jgi:hypothetical protein
MYSMGEAKPDQHQHRYRADQPDRHGEQVTVWR